MMEYKGYIGKVDFDAEAGIIHGEVINIRDIITFQGDSVAAVKQAFHESVDDYLKFCQTRGEPPDKPFFGQFVTRIPPELHRQVNVAAVLAGKSLNAWVTEQLQQAVQRTEPHKDPADRKPAANPSQRRSSTIAPKKRMRKTRDSD